MTTAQQLLLSYVWFAVLFAAFLLLLHTRRKTVKQRDDARTVCAQAYQVLGHITIGEELKFDSSQTEKLLDNLSEAKPVHDDELIFPFTIMRTVPAHELERAKLRIDDLEELLVSARAICERRGKDTAWARFDSRIESFGIGSVTPRVFKLAPYDNPNEA